uniref:Chloride channel, putative n=1 Tax=Chlorobium chlorochromatii (strain CaD3) TaxID=340177 RepID=Q3AQR7_CHLCH
MNILSHKKGRLARRIIAFFYILFRRSRYFKGSSQNFIKLTLEYILVQLNLNQDIPFLFVAVIVGLVTGYVAVLFHEAIKAISNFSFNDLRLLGDISFIEQYWVFFLPFIPAIGGLFVGLYNTFIIKKSSRHALASVIKSVAHNDGIIDRKLWFHKTITSVVCIGTGGGGGREAPIVQVGSAIGSTIAQWLRFSPEKTRTLLGCGAAAGLAAVFNAPIGAVMFAIEVLLGDFSVKTFSPIVIAAVIGTVLSRSFLGNRPTFDVPDYTLVSNIELLFYCVLGVLAGLSAVMFIKTYFAIEEWFDKLQIRRNLPVWIMPAIGGFLSGIICIWLPGLYGFSYNVISNAVYGNETWYNLIGIYLLKPVVAGLSIGSGGAGGMFAPAMKMGAMLGGMFGIVVHQFFPLITATSGAYALVGMGALTAGVMRAPLTVILILFEITGQYEIVLPIMFAAVTSAVVARLAYRHSMETYVLEKQGIKVGFGIALSVAEQVVVSDILDKKRTQFVSTTPMKKILEVFYSTPETNFLIVDKQGVFIGNISLDDIRILLKNGCNDDLIADDIVNKNVPVLYTNSRLDEALKLFELSDYDILPVLDTKNNILQGVLRQEKAFASYRKQLNLYGSDYSDKSVHQGVK